MLGPHGESPPKYVSLTIGPRRFKDEGATGDGGRKTCGQASCHGVPCSSAIGKQIFPVGAFTRDLDLVRVAVTVRVLVELCDASAPYYATKGAVINLTRDLAVEWAPHRINVNAIAPGFFTSEMTQGIFASPEYVEYVRKQTPLGRARRTT